MSNIKFSGIVGKPETRFTPDGKPCLSFGVGLYRGKLQNGEYAPRRWFKVEAWNELAESSKDIVQSGKPVTVTGWLKPPRTWKDRDGETHVAEDEVNAVEVTAGDAFKVLDEIEY